MGLATVAAFFGGAVAGAGFAAINGGNSTEILVGGISGGIGGVLSAPSGYNAGARVRYPELPAWAPNGQNGLLPTPKEATPQTPSPFLCAPGYYFHPQLGCRLP